MCQVHFIGRIDGKPLDEEDLEEFKWITEQGGEYNKDATGYCSTGVLHKEGIPADEYFKKYWPVIKLSLAGKSFVVAHNRLGTGGDAKENINNHPFSANSRLGRIVAVHNGVLQNHEFLRNTEQLICESVLCDSAVIPALVAKYIDAGLKPEEAVKKCAEAITGSYSVFVLIQGRLYYFKSSSTRFTFGLIEFEDGKRVLVGSTSEENVKMLYSYLEMIFMKPSYRQSCYCEPDEGQIYIYDGKEIRKGEEFVVKSYSYQGKVSQNGTWSNYDYDEYGEAGYSQAGRYFKNTSMQGQEIINEAHRNEIDQLISEAGMMRKEAEITETEQTTIIDNAEGVSLEDYNRYTDKQIARDLLATSYCDDAETFSYTTIADWINDVSEIWLTEGEHDRWISGKLSKKEAKNLRKKILARARNAYKTAETQNWITSKEWMTDAEKKEWMTHQNTGEDWQQGYDIESKSEERMKSALCLKMMEIDRAEEQEEDKALKAMQKDKENVIASATPPVLDPIEATDERSYVIHPVRKITDAEREEKLTEDPDRDLED